ncbi:hypothetical protein COO60DRAFT_1486274 [Scenedesmus sp. NREL 46B-D3]|nr:hypothetical protein COO60DRAFT_1486274 [Scenedesmus sp. NREL 46B-D3]
MPMNTGGASPASCMWVDICNVLPTMTGLRPSTKSVARPELNTPCSAPPRRCMLRACSVMLGVVTCCWPCCCCCCGVMPADCCCLSCSKPCATVQPDWCCWTRAAGAACRGRLGHTALLQLPDGSTIACSRLVILQPVDPENRDRRAPREDLPQDLTSAESMM